MSCIIIKPKGVPFIQKEAEFEMIFEDPFYLGLAYANGKKVLIEKFKHDYPKATIEMGFKHLETLTEHSVICFFGYKKNKRFEKLPNNMSPIKLRDNIAYVAAGKVLSLSKSLEKQYTPEFYFKQWALDKMLDMHPDMFFSWEGRWLMERVTSFNSAMAFLRADGKTSIINFSECQKFKGMYYFDTDIPAQRKIISTL